MLCAPGAGHMGAPELGGSAERPDHVDRDVGSHSLHTNRPGTRGGVETETLASSAGTSHRCISRDAAGVRNRRVQRFFLASGSFRARGSVSWRRVETPNIPAHHGGVFEPGAVAWNGFMFGQACIPGR